MFELPKFWLSASVSPLFQCQTLRDFLKIHHGNSGKCVSRGSKNEKFSGGHAPRLPKRLAPFGARSRRSREQFTNRVGPLTSRSVPTPLSSITINNNQHSMAD